MSQRVREHIRHNVIGYVALFVALSGTAYATHPGGTNTISTADIIDGEVRSADVNNGGVRTEDLGDGVVTSAKIGNSQVKEADIGDGEVHSIDITNGAVHGIDVTNDDLKGADIDESSLNGVNADQLDGQDSSAFARGRTFFWAQVVEHNGNGITYSEEVANVANRFSVYYGCNSNGNGDVTFYNRTGGAMNLFADDGRENPTFTELAADASVNYPADYRGDRHVFSYQGNAPGFVLGSVAVEGFRRTNDCHVQVQALLSG